MSIKSVALASTALAALAAMVGAAQADISDNVVKIGVLNDRSGLYADLSGEGSVVAARMAVEDFGGKVGDADIEVVSADHQNKPDVGSSIAREWIDQDGVDVIVDVPTSSVALAVQQVTSEKDTAFLDSGAGSTALTNDQCAPTFVHWTYDTYAMSVGTGKAVVEQGGKSWFFLTADYAFGHQLEKDTSAVVKENGGEVLGSVNHPLSTSDFSSFLLQAQASGADVIGLANAGGDTTNAIKQANSFGIVQGGQKLAALLGFITDVDALGLDVAQGLTLTTGFYWDRTDETREFADRFAEKMNGQKPTMVQAGVYSAVTHYLKAVDEIDDDGGEAVVTQMKKMPINDFFAENGKIREDGRMVHDMYLVEVKSPDQSEGKWDYYNIVKTIPGDEAFQPLDKGSCKLVSN
ncbi:ABC transporter permease [Afifella marina DSM 2698]|uniref:Branched-chain amino acid transport system substrate-binding protein n=1 Tax=Afifella marina DSM 2698 TaxID=1120955 RepID=A0A1G5MWJ3_AFIMA|nr:ABC transporter substrate-binding protein [Afifella marina]MBK1622110.1 ABC transporter permease [Afifella marina DSM 2698]MBK1627902.1 ABC transporter permease [Afifella marina]MBK5918032.1 ABC transporter permease [Afifella marina]RAI19811.1 ABC transporter permease [Afifella marina DSM 2698]SCZ29567.1 branched-chain amino acid transport system substrate-binding protein [Afifella marina DSM 2698]